MAGYGTVQTFAKRSALATDSIESHQEFVKKHGLPFPLLSDSDQEIVKAYQVWAEKSIDGEKRMGTERTTYLIGPDRKIKAILKRVKPAEHVTQLLNTLDSQTGFRKRYRRRISVSVIVFLNRGLLHYFHRRVSPSISDHEIHAGNLLFRGCNASCG